MTQDQGKKPELEPQSPTRQETKIESTELGDQDLEKVCGGVSVGGVPIYYDDIGRTLHVAMAVCGQDSHSDLKEMLQDMNAGRGKK